MEVPDYRRRKLTPDQVQRIRWMIADGISYLKIANKFGVTKVSIFNIAMRRTWKWLKDESPRIPLDESAERADL